MEDEFTISAATCLLACGKITIVAAPASALIVVCARIVMAHVERESQYGAQRMLFAAFLLGSAVYAANARGFAVFLETAFPAEQKFTGE